jgi:acyl-CoA synthetase (AMP-forming)/AMP-acid ligase II
MRDVANRPLLISPRSETFLSYAEFCRELVAPEVLLRPWCRPANVAEAGREIVRALVFSTEVTLFDADWSDSEIRTLGYSTDQLGTVRTVSGLPRVEPADLAAAVSAASSARINLFTSGTTGRPTLVRHSLASLTRGVKISATHGDDRWAFAYNPTHFAGVQVFLQALANLNTLVDVTGLERLAILGAFRRHGVSHVSATPTFYRLLLPCDQPLDGVRSVALGGEVSAGHLHEELGRAFPAATLRNIYASTEAGSLLVSRGETFGIPPAMADAIIVREGRLHLHRRLMADFPGPWVEGEWCDTGDRVEMVEEDPVRFRFAGRERDSVNVGGYKVNPLEVEAVLGEHPGVGHVRVFGRKNSVMGQILCAEVVRAKADSGLPIAAGESDLPQTGASNAKESGEQTTDGGQLTEAALRAFAAERLPPWKIPRLIRFVDHLASTRTGKLSRTEDDR